MLVLYSFFNWFCVNRFDLLGFIDIEAFVWDLHIETSVKIYEWYCIMHEMLFILHEIKLGIVFIYAGFGRTK